MSSFICSSNHFNSIECTLQHLLKGDTFRFPYELEKSYPDWFSRFTKTNKQISESISKIIDILRELNVICVSLQYRHHNAGNIDNEIKAQLYMLRKSKGGSVLTLHGLYNALNCLVYQIEIEHLEELRELLPEEKASLNFANVMINGIAKHIVDHMPEDNTCKWSI